MLGRLIPLLLLSTLAAPARGAAQSDCTGAINKFRAVIESDAATGNLNRSVYGEMQPGIAQSVGLCQSGRAAEALRTLAGIKHRYGYR